LNVVRRAEIIALHKRDQRSNEKDVNATETVRSKE